MLLRFGVCPQEVLLKFTLIPNVSGKLGELDPKLYRSISLDSYDFTTLSDDFLGKIYFQVNLSFSDWS